MELLNAINLRRKENHIKKSEKKASPVITNHYAPPAEQFLEIRDNHPQEWDTRREDLERVLKPSTSFKIYSRTTTPVNRPMSVLEDIVSEAGLKQEYKEFGEGENPQKLHFIDVSPLSIQLPVKTLEDGVVEEEINTLPCVTGGDWTQSSRSASRASNRIAEVFKKKNARAVRIRSARSSRSVRAKSPEVIKPVIEHAEVNPKQNYFADSNGKSCVIKTEPCGGIMDRSSRAASAYKSRKSDYLSTSMPEYHALEVYEVKKPNTISKMQSSKSLSVSNSQSIQKINDEFGSKRSIKSAPLCRSMTANSARKIFSGELVTSFSTDTQESKKSSFASTKAPSSESDKGSLTKKESKCRFQPISEAINCKIQTVREESFTDDPRISTTNNDDRKIRNIVLENLSLKPRPFSCARQSKSAIESKIPRLKSAPCKIRNHGSITLGPLISIINPAGTRRVTIDILDVDAIKRVRSQTKTAKKFSPDLKDFKEIELHHEIEKLDSMLSKLGR
ncbi:hypothetical protein HDV06_000564 [Boothiomyces sp. JEL0866]|nr:hypothetical protein HDV06_000564 [Boothiomyces sp. JEL0866]